MSLFQKMAKTETRMPVSHAYSSGQEKVLNTSIALRDLTTVAVTTSTMRERENDLAASLGVASRAMCGVCQ